MSRGDGLCDERTDTVYFGGVVVAIVGDGAEGFGTTGTRVSIGNGLSDREPANVERVYAEVGAGAGGSEGEEVLLSESGLSL